MFEWFLEYQTKYETYKSYAHYKSVCDDYSLAELEDEGDRGKELIRKNKEWMNSDHFNRFADILHLEEIMQFIPETCSRLVLIPHLMMHLFPIHTLQGKRKKSKGKYEISGALMELFSEGVSYAPSCQVLQQLQQRKLDAFSNLIALQTPTEDLYEKDLGTVGAIKQQFPNSHILKKDKAKKATLIQRSDQENQQTINSNQELITVNCLFFFCHGYYNMESPLDSGLHLADGYVT